MLTELSYTLHSTIPKWPTNPGETLEFVLSMDDGARCNASSIYHHMHNGTHVDAPKHFFNHGAAIEQLPIEDFYYIHPLVLHLPKKKGERVMLEDLLPHADAITQADLLCLYTGYASLRQQQPEVYIDGFPTIAPEAAHYLRHQFAALKAVALDVISVDDAVTGPSAGFPTHKAFLAGNEPRPLLLYEDVNLQKLWDIRHTVTAVCAFPIRFAGAEAAPVNIVAVSE